MRKIIENFMPEIATGPSFHFSTKTSQTQTSETHCWRLQLAQSEKDFADFCLQSTLLSSESKNIIL